MEEGGIADEMVALIKLLRKKLAGLIKGCCLMRRRLLIYGEFLNTPLPCSH